MRCKVCGRESNVVCICGYCPECNKRYTHEECAQIVKEKEEQKHKPHETDFWKSLSKTEQDKIEELNK